MIQTVEPKIGARCALMKFVRTWKAVYLATVVKITPKRIYITGGRYFDRSTLRSLSKGNGYDQYAISFEASDLQALDQLAADRAKQKEERAKQAESLSYQLARAVSNMPIERLELAGEKLLQEVLDAVKVKQ